MEHQELYDQISKVLTWYENPKEYPLNDGIRIKMEFNKRIAKEMYDVLVRVQNEMFNH